jgi:LysM repeat protein
MRSKACPHIGLPDDPETFQAYPSDANICHRARPPATPNFNHQSSYCLTISFGHCPMLATSASMPLPLELQVEASSTQKRWWIGGSIAAVAVLIFLAIIWWQGGRPASSAPLMTETIHVVATRTPAQPTVTLASVLTPTVSPTMDFAITPTAPEVPTEVLQPTVTPEVKSSPTACAVPAGWVAYVVRSGDTLSSIGQVFRVSVRDLQAGNCMGVTVTIYVNQKLYVPNVSTSTPASQPTSTSVQVSPTSSPPPTDTPTVHPSNTPIPTSTPTDTVEPKTYP